MDTVTVGLVIVDGDNQNHWANSKVSSETVGDSTPRANEIRSIPFALLKNRTYVRETSTASQQAVNSNIALGLFDGHSMRTPSL